jgi:imidazolonepropionase-like amidohydrolase
MRRILRRAAYTLLALLLLAIAAFSAGVLLPEQALHIEGAPAAVAFRHATVIDPRDGTLLRDATLVVKDKRIVALGPEGTVALPAGIRHLDAGGKFLIPGLWDMHIHSWFRMSDYLHYPLFIAHGVTSVRDMGGCLDEAAPFFACDASKRAWSARAEAGQAIGPRIVASGSFPIDAQNRMSDGFPAFLAPSTAADARALVAHAKANGWDFIKLHNNLARDAYFALMDEARQRGMTVAGHLPASVGAAEAARAGQKSIEHAALFPLECSTKAEALRHMEHRPRGAELLQAVLPAYSASRCGDVFAALADNGTWFTPTHVTRRYEALAADPAFLADARLDYVNAAWRLAWQLDANRMRKELAKPGAQALFTEFYRRGLDLTGQAHRSGVTVLAGSDAPDAYVFPGSSLHDELQELVKAGLTPAQALRAATYDPARFAGQEQRYGTLESGKAADLVVLDANPLDDIAHTRRIHAVMFNGYLYEQPQLAGMHAFVRSKAASFSVSCKAVWSLLRSREFRNMFAD